MADSDDRKKLVRAMARVTALRKQLDEHRRALKAHASERLDATAHAVGVASDAMKDPEHRHILTHRYLRTQLTEAARLRAIEGRGAKDDQGEDEDADTGAE